MRAAPLSGYYAQGNPIDDAPEDSWTLRKWDRE